MYGAGISDDVSLRHTHLGFELTTSLYDNSKLIYEFAYLNKKYSFDKEYLSRDFFSTAIMAEFGDLFKYGLGGYFNIKLYENNSQNFESQSSLNDFGFFLQGSYKISSFIPLIRLVYSPIENENISILVGLRYKLYGN
jgi:hypothetical protein